MINESTLERAIEIAKSEGELVTELNAVEFFKKALVQEMELSASTAEDVRHQFGRGYDLMNEMRPKVYRELRCR